MARDLANPQLSLLFCASTALTEWITTRKVRSSGYHADVKYLVYSAYSHIVGQFLPQETIIKWMWTAVTGSWPRYEREVYKRGSELYAEAVREGSILGNEEDDLSASNIRVKDRIVRLVPSKKK